MAINAQWLQNDNPKKNTYYPWKEENKDQGKYRKEEVPAKYFKQANWHENKALENYLNHKYGDQEDEKDPWVAVEEEIEKNDLDSYNPSYTSEEFTDYLNKQNNDKWKEVYEKKLEINEQNVKKITGLCSKLYGKWTKAKIEEIEVDGAKCTFESVRKKDTAKLKEFIRKWWNNYKLQLQQGNKETKTSQEKNAPESSDPFSEDKKKIISKPNTSPSEPSKANKQANKLKFNLLQFVNHMVREQFRECSS